MRLRSIRDAIYPHYQRPELLATTPNQLWSWDITELKSLVKWTFFYLYVVLDIFSHYVVGWMVASRESAALAKQLLLESFFETRHPNGPTDDSS